MFAVVCGKYAMKLGTLFFLIIWFVFFKASFSNADGVFTAQTDEFAECAVESATVEQVNNNQLLKMVSSTEGQINLYKRLDFLLGTQEVVELCLLRDQIWMSFCDGLIQGYAETAQLLGKSCIPIGTKRRDLVDLFTSPKIVTFNGFIDDWPALESATEIFLVTFPCS